MPTRGRPANKQRSATNSSRTRYFAWAMLLLSLFSGGYCFLAAAPANLFQGDSGIATPAVAAESKLQPVEKLLTRKIQNIHPGQRVLADNPELEGKVPPPLNIKPADWRLLSLQMDKPDGSVLDIELLRPLTWMNDVNARVGETVELNLAELGAAGQALVKTISACPTLEKGEGRVVTGRFAHAAANVVDVKVAGLKDAIGTTDNHPFWSEDRQAFVPAGNLRIGEHLRTALGTTTRVTSITPRGPPERVYNIEVAGEHVYYVADGGVLVHNGCDEFIDVYHYTDLKGYNAIRAGGKKVMFKAGSGSKHGKGAYFTELSPSQIGNKAKAKIGVTKAKFQYFFKVRVPKDALKKVRGSVNYNKVYSPKDILADLLDSGPV